MNKERTTWLLENLHVMKEATTQVIEPEVGFNMSAWYKREPECGTVVCAMGTFIFDPRAYQSGLYWRLNRYDYCKEEVDFTTATSLDEMRSLLARGYEPYIMEFDGKVGNEAMCAWLGLDLCEVFDLFYPESYYPHGGVHSITAHQVIARVEYIMRKHEVLHPEAAVCTAPVTQKQEQ